MFYAFALPDACMFAWGEHGVWITKDQAWFADDPFVQAHPELFSLTPPNVRSTIGRTVDQVPMSVTGNPQFDVLVKPTDVTTHAYPTPRSKGRANG